MNPIPTDSTILTTDVRTVHAVAILSPNAQGSDASARLVLQKTNGSAVVISFDHATPVKAIEFLDLLSALLAKLFFDQEGDAYYVRLKEQVAQLHSEWKPPAENLTPGNVDAMSDDDVAAELQRRMDAPVTVREASP